MRLPTHTPWEEYRAVQATCRIPHCPNPWNCVVELTIQASGLPTEVARARQHRAQQWKKKKVPTTMQGTPSLWYWEEPAQPPVPRESCPLLPRQPSSTPPSRPLPPRSLPPKYSDKSNAPSNALTMQRNRQAEGLNDLPTPLPLQREAELLLRAWRSSSATAGLPFPLPATRARRDMKPAAKHLWGSIPMQ